MDKLTVLKSVGHAEMHPKAKGFSSESLSLRSHGKLVKGKHCTFLNAEQVQGTMYQLTSYPERCQSKC